MAVNGGSRITWENVVYDRDGSDLHGRGLYLDLRPWQTSVFALTRNPPGS